MDEPFNNIKQKKLVTIKKSAMKKKHTIILAGSFPQLNPDIYFWQAV